MDKPVKSPAFLFYFFGEILAYILTGWRQIWHDGSNGGGNRNYNCGAWAGGEVAYGTATRTTTVTATVQFFNRRR